MALNRPALLEARQRAEGVLRGGLGADDSGNSATPFSVHQSVPWRGLGCFVTASSLLVKVVVMKISALGLIVFLPQSFLVWRL